MHLMRLEACQEGLCLMRPSMLFFRLATVGMHVVRKTCAFMRLSILRGRYKGVHGRYNGFYWRYNAVHGRYNAVHERYNAVNVGVGVGLRVGDQKSKRNR